MAVTETSCKLSLKHHLFYCKFLVYCIFANIYKIPLLKTDDFLSLKKRLMSLVWNLTPEVLIRCFILILFKFLVRHICQDTGLELSLKPLKD